ncbi:MAG: hypothetical protein ACREXX_14965 [Gammaproteobacteria bacterium]
MATDHPTPETGEDDRFNALSSRLESTINRLKLAAKDLYDLSIEAISNNTEHSSAAYVVVEATEDLVQLYEDFNTWYLDYLGYPKAPKEVQS